jgi:hypothetical protein
MKSKGMMKAARVEYWWGQKFLQSCSPEIWPHRSTRPRRQKSWNGVWICGCSGGLLRAFGVHENGDKLLKRDSYLRKRKVRFIKSHSSRAPVVGAFTKFAKSHFYFRHVCPSIRLSSWNNWMDFHESLYLSIFRKSVKKIQVSFKCDKNNGYFTWRPIYIFDHILLIFS